MNEYDSAQAIGSAGAIGVGGLLAAREIGKHNKTIAHSRRVVEETNAMSRRSDSLLKASKILGATSAASTAPSIIGARHGKVFIPVMGTLTGVAALGAHAMRKNADKQVLNGIQLTKNLSKKSAGHIGKAGLAVAGTAAVVAGIGKARASIERTDSDEGLMYLRDQQNMAQYQQPQATVPMV